MRDGLTGRFAIPFCGLLLLACGAKDVGKAPAPIQNGLAFVRRFPTATNPGAHTQGCTFASPVAIDDGGVQRVAVADASGTITALDAKTGAAAWQVTLPAPSGEQAFVVSTPVVVGGLLVVAYHTVAAGAPLTVTSQRLRHRVAVVDIEAHALSADYPAFDLTAGGTGPDGAFSFDPTHALARSALVHGVPPGSVNGRVYVTFANARDLQPYRGWMFEVDLDAWKASGPGAALTANLPVMQEVNCGPNGGDGAKADVCGGGIWSPAGPLVDVRSDGSGYDVVVGVGNGQLNPARGDYGNTLLRTRPGLGVTTGCDPTACGSFSVQTLASSCVETCTDLFIPRLLPGEDPILPASGECAGLGVWDCWIAQDQLDAGSSPVAVDVPNGPRVFVYPTKDGHLWLIDSARMGTVYAHQKLTESCGTTSDPCATSWSGTIVAQPAVTTVNGAPLVIVPTFMPDNTHAAGVFALTLAMNGGAPQLQPAWQFPAASDPASTTAFRSPPSRVTLGTPAPGSTEYAFVVEPGSGSPGQLYALRTSDGVLAAQVGLAGPGYRHSQPLYMDGAVFAPSCDHESGPGSLEGYDVVPQ
jgi:outer membrane protein assembly factor BamB